MMKILFNPFVKIAGYKALIYGWVAILITASIAYFSRTHFGGVIDVRPGAKALWWVYLLEPFVPWISVTLDFYIMGVLFSKSKIRFADVAGTFALARFPMLFVALLAFALRPDIQALDKIYFLTIVNTIALICVTWMIALFYNAYTISCNLKQGTAVWTFIVGLIAAEIISQIILYQLNKHFFIYA